MERKMVREYIKKYFSASYAFFDQVCSSVAIMIIALMFSSFYTKTAHDFDGEGLAHGHDDKVQKMATENLFRAVCGKRSNIELVRKTIGEHADINAKNDASGMTPLMYASGKRHPEVIQLLLECNANPNIQATPRIIRVRTGGIIGRYTNIMHDDFGSTALMNASSMGHIDSVCLLLEYNADPNIKDARGYTALTHTRYADTRIIERLILCGADVSAVDDRGFTILDTTTPAGLEIIAHGRQKRIALEKELGQQNWDFKFFSPMSILEKFITVKDCVLFVCDYADPYGDSIEESLLHAKKYYIRNNRLSESTVVSPASASAQAICCAVYPECSCSGNLKKKKMRGKCAIQ